MWCPEKWHKEKKKKKAQVQIYSRHILYAIIFMVQHHYTRNCLRRPAWSGHMEQAFHKDNIGAFSLISDRLKWAGCEWLGW